MVDIDINYTGELHCTANHLPSGVMVETVEKSLFYKSIETFGTAIAQNSKTYRVKKNNILGNFNIDNRFVKKGDIIVALKNNETIVADFAGKFCLLYTSPSPRDS